MAIYWDAGICELYTNTRVDLANAARSHNWDIVFSILDEHEELINCSRPGGASLYTPLHQVAYAGGPIEVAQRLVDMGAWRTIQNCRGERPVDVAERKGHTHLLGHLEPQLKRSVPIGVLLKIEQHLHGLLRQKIQRQVPNRNHRLPALEPLLELDLGEMWFVVPEICEMYSGVGRFSYEFSSFGANATLDLKQCWPQESFEITSNGVCEASRAF